MNIKSLLLGSAAAIVAVSGARAADVIVPVAPEPAEYVRICDVYGTGFYYIPGTETCLKIGGYVRYKIIAAGNLEDTSTSTTSPTAKTMTTGSVRGSAFV
jgi:opacity protein-like surface antigen